MTYETVSAVFVVLFINLILIYNPRVPLLNVIFGVFSMLLGVACFNNASVPFQPWFPILFSLVGLLGMWRAVDARRGGTL